MIANRKICVALPAYNAGQTLEATFNEISATTVVDDVMLPRSLAQVNWTSKSRANHLILLSQSVATFAERNHIFEKALREHQEVVAGRGISAISELWPSRLPSSGSDNRRFLEAVLWIVRTGSPWRDVPPFFGNWNTIFKRYRDWVKADVFTRLVKACSNTPDMEYAMVDPPSSRSIATARAQKGGLRARPSAVPTARYPGGGNSGG